MAIINTEALRLKAKKIEKEIPVITFEDIKNKAIKNIRDQAQSKMDEANKDYAPYEISTFAKQQNEWASTRGKGKGNTHTPLIDILSTARGLSRSTILDKIGANITFEYEILGKQQAKIDAINSCNTIEELEALEG